jgi:hypothetical protein
MLFVDAGFTTIICMLGYILIHALSSDVCIYKSAITIQRTTSPQRSYVRRTWESLESADELTESGSCAACLD